MGEENVACLCFALLPHHTLSACEPIKKSLIIKNGDGLAKRSWGFEDAKDETVQL